MQPNLGNEPGASLKPSRNVSNARQGYRSHELNWDGLQLKLGRGRVVATVEPDSKWPGMYRVRCGGKLSDMVNLTRAKDAARSLALMELNT
jgi:hypothetical protein